MDFYEPIWLKRTMILMIDNIELYVLMTLTLLQVTGVRESKTSLTFVDNYLKSSINLAEIWYSVEIFSDLLAL